MPDYSKAKIYKLTSIHTDKIYIGSTVQSLKHRYTNHNCKTNDCTSKILFNLGECNIQLILDYPCNYKHELELIESYYIQKNNCVNHYHNIGSNKERKHEYYKKNKEMYNIRTNEYNEKNKVYLIQYRKEYRERNKYKINKEIKAHKDKIYRENNKDKFKEYRAKNKEYKKQSEHFRRTSVFGQLCKLYNI